MLRCSFCNKTEDEVQKLVAGPKVYICDECVEVASRIMSAESRPKSLTRRMWERLRFPSSPGRGGRDIHKMIPFQNGAAGVVD